MLDFEAFMQQNLSKQVAYRRLSLQWYLLELKCFVVISILQKFLWSAVDRNKEFIFLFTHTNAHISSPERSNFAYGQRMAEGT